jgi:hypothetical protein
MGEVKVCWALRGVKIYTGRGSKGVWWDDRCGILSMVGLFALRHGQQLQSYWR